MMFEGYALTHKHTNTYTQIHTLAGATRTHTNPGRSHTDTHTLCRGPPPHTHTLPLAIVLNLHNPTLRSPDAWKRPSDNAMPSVRSPKLRTPILNSGSVVTNTLSANRLLLSQLTTPLQEYLGWEVESTSRASRGQQRAS
jgi:hypothetical protein